MKKDTDWFEELYNNAKGDSCAIPWAKLEPDPLLKEFLSNNTNLHGRALVIGCGLGDDAKALSDAGFDTVAFDISQSAIEWAKKRFEESDIEFSVHDVFELPKEYIKSFDFVFESLTIQSLPITFRPEIIEAITSTVAPNGKLLVVAHGKNEGEKYGGPPYPLLINELGLFKMYGLTQLEFSIYDEPSNLSSLKFKALYQNRCH